LLFFFDTVEMFAPFQIRLKLVLQQPASADFLFHQQTSALLVKRLKLFPAALVGFVVVVALGQQAAPRHSAKRV
tara:strand:- start:954 stop:1175 length:222 start_codon:yes stop_codon:yes gene_type:complete